MSPSEIAGIFALTLKVALLAMALIAVPGVAAGYLLARARFPGLALVRTAVTLPLVLPPVAVGLFLLKALSVRSPLGRAIETLFGAPILLTWWAAAIASAAMAFPLLVLGAEQAFAAVPRRLEDVAATLGLPRWRVFLRVTLPLASRGIAYGAVFAFARALGEFCATSIVAGRIPGRTETVALAIYGCIECFRERDALLLAALATLVAFLLTAAAETWLRRRPA